VDEEWPLGSLLPAEGGLEIGPGLWEHGWPLGIGLSPDDGRCFNSPVAAETFPRVSGACSGPQRPVGTYWKPRGFQRACRRLHMPFFNERQDFISSIIFDPSSPSRQQKGDLARISGAHVVPRAICGTGSIIPWRSRSPREMEGSICTGFRLFFHDRRLLRVLSREGCPYGSAAQLWRAPRARTGEHFKKNRLLAMLKEPYQPGPRPLDPVVFRHSGHPQQRPPPPTHKPTHPQPRLFHMLVYFGKWRARLVPAAWRVPGRTGLALILQENW
jgi:hypothetical protein